MCSLGLNYYYVIQVTPSSMIIAQPGLNVEEGYSFLLSCFVCCVEKWQVAVCAQTNLQNQVKLRNNSSSSLVGRIELL